MQRLDSALNDATWNSLVLKLIVNALTVKFKVLLVSGMLLAMRSPTSMRFCVKKSGAGTTIRDAMILVMPCRIVP
jgi:hypothetical protein